MALTYVPVSSLGVGALFLISFFLLTAFIAVCLRIWSLHIVNRAARLHDYLIFLALFLSCGHVIVIYLAIMVGGMGHHIEVVPPTALLTLLKLFFAANLTWLFSTSIVKASILCLYLDLFQVQKTFQKVVYGFLAFVAVFFVAFFISVLTICRPVSHLWNPLGEGSCGNSTQSQIATSSINTIVDLAIVILPIPVLLKLRMSSKKRARVIGIFAVGAIICVINIIRLVTTIVLPQADLTYNLIGPAILTCLEVEIGIVTACLPTISPVFTRASQAFRSGWTLPFFNTSRNTRSSATRINSESNEMHPSKNTMNSSEKYYNGSNQYKSFATTAVQSSSSNKMSTSSLMEDQTILVTRDVTVQNGSSSPVTTSNGERV